MQGYHTVGGGGGVVQRYRHKIQIVLTVHKNLRRAQDGETDGDVEQTKGDGEVWTESVSRDDGRVR